MSSTKGSIRHSFPALLAAATWVGCAAPPGAGVAGSPDAATMVPIRGPGAGADASPASGGGADGAAGGGSGPDSAAGTGLANDAGSIPVGVGDSAGVASDGSQGGSGSLDASVRESGTAFGGPEAGMPIADASPTGDGGKPGNGGSVVQSGMMNLGAGCTVAWPVGFKENLQGFLITACGGGNGCHVVDTSSNHAYDWITDYSHCPDKQPRFQKVMDLVSQANPASCSNSRQMPPPGGRTPLTSCEIAQLQAWLNEPLLIQTHNRNLMTYPMPPYN